MNRFLYALCISLGLILSSSAVSAEKVEGEPVLTEGHESWTHFVLVSCEANTVFIESFASSALTDLTAEEFAELPHGELDDLSSHYEFITKYYIEEKLISISIIVSYVNSSSIEDTQVSYILHKGQWHAFETNTLDFEEPQEYFNLFELAVEEELGSDYEEMYAKCYR